MINCICIYITNNCYNYSHLFVKYGKITIHLYVATILRTMHAFIQSDHFAHYITLSHLLSWNISCFIFVELNNFINQSIVVQINHFDIGQIYMYITLDGWLSLRLCITIFTTFMCKIHCCHKRTERGMVLPRVKLVHNHTHIRTIVLTCRLYLGVLGPKQFCSINNVTPFCNSQSIRGTKTVLKKELATSPW